MKPQKVLSRKNEATRLPIWGSLVCYLSLVHFQAPQWVWITLGILFLLFWICAITRMSNEVQVDLFEENDPTNASDRLMERIAEMQKDRLRK